MQEQRQDNVISLFQPLSPSGTPTRSMNPAPGDESFADTMRKNAENQKRLQEDRAKANKSVLRSYRIKK